MSKAGPEIPRFETESQEADWWASAKLVARLSKASTQIALRIPDADLRRAREIAERKGVGCQTLLKMPVHEGLEREARSR